MKASHTPSRHPSQQALQQAGRPVSHAAEQEIKALLKYGFIFDQQPDGLHMKHEVMGFDVVLPAAHVTAKENKPTLNDLLAAYNAAVRQPTTREQDFADRMQPDWREHMPPAVRMRTPRTQMFMGVCAARGLA